MNARHGAFAMALLFTAALGLYAAGAAPTVLFGDSAELQSVALEGGIAHTTGYPAFLIVGRAFGALPFDDPAYRINFMSSFFGALDLVLIVLVALELGVPLWIAVTTAVLYGTSYTFGAASMRAEVYTISLCLFLLAVWRSLVALRTREWLHAWTAGFLLGLSLTGHLAFMLPVAVIGTTLAWRLGGPPRLAPARLAILLLVFVAGLTPYLYLFWADQQSFTFNYLDFAERAVLPLGPPDPGFDETHERVRWLIFDRNEIPPLGFHFQARAVIREVAHALGHLLLFEPGPIGALLAAAGAWQILHSDRLRGLMVVLAIAASVLFAGTLTSGGMVAIFLIPALPLMMLLAGLGIATVWQRGVAAGRAPGYATLVLAIVCVISVAGPAHALRIMSFTRPIGPAGWQVLEEATGENGVLVPRWNDPYAARRFGESALDVIPQGALVIGPWKELKVIDYLHHVEGRRPDLALQPGSFPALLTRMQDWQQQHALEQHPFVFLQRHAAMTDYYRSLDSLQVADGAWIYVQREPVSDVPVDPYEYLVRDLGLDSAPRSLFERVKRARP